MSINIDLVWFVVVAVAVAVVVAVFCGVWGKRSPNSIYINSRSTALAAVMLVIRVTMIIIVTIINKRDGAPQLSGGRPLPSTNC